MTISQYSGIFGLLLSISYIYGFIRLQLPLHRIFGYVPFSPNDYLIAGVPPILCATIFFVLIASVYNSVFDRLMKCLIHEICQTDYEIPKYAKWFPLIYFFTRNKKKRKLFYVIVIIALMILIWFLFTKHMFLFVISITVLYSLLFLDFYFGAQLFQCHIFNLYQEMSDKINKNGDGEIDTLNVEVSKLLKESSTNNYVDISQYAKAKNHVDRMKAVRKAADENKEAIITLQWLVEKWVPFCHYINVTRSSPDLCVNYLSQNIELTDLGNLV